MTERRSSTSPSRIRAIRETLGLTQREAGRLLGGGVRAFEKYEDGTRTPRVATINLLRVLEAHPDALRILLGDESPRASSGLPSPFRVNGEHLGSLTAAAFAALLRRLLHAEAQASGLPLDGIHVASNINAPDGGEDGRISWRDGPSHTPFLPSRLCQFQLKTGSIEPAAAARDVLTSGGDVKPMVRSVLEGDGYYIMLSARTYTQQQVEARERAIRDALATAGLTVPDHVIGLREADQIAEWVNTHPSVALWVREKAELGPLGPFASWQHWKDRSEHSSSWVDDSRLSDLLSAFQRDLTQYGSVLRVVGLSGIGKSRLCLEALKRAGENGIVVRPLRDFVMYAVASEVGAEAVHRVVENLAVSGGRAVVIVDDCDAQLHRVLAGLVSRRESRLSLVTIDETIPSRFDDATIRIEKAPRTVIEPIVDQIAPELSSLDRQRLVRFSEGFPGVAIRVGRNAGSTPYLADPADDQLIDDFVLGRSSDNRQLVLQSAELLAVFAEFRLEPQEVSEGELATEDDITRIADLGRQLTRDDLYAGVGELVQRGVIKQRGVLGTIQPRPIVDRLAERQWRAWHRGKWDRVLSGDIGADLSIRAARRLAQLNFTDIADSVVSHMSRSGGLLDPAGGILDARRAEILSALAEIDADAVAEHIDRSLDRLGDLRQLEDTVRRPLVHALRIIAFPSSTFMAGGRLLLRLAISGNASGGSESSHPFVQLFSPLLGGTEADGDARLLLLEEAADTSNPGQLEYVVEALTAGCNVGTSPLTVGPELHGSRSALHPWHPNSNQEWATYIAECVDRLGQLAVRDDAAGVKARSHLGLAISSLVHHGFLEAVEQAIYRVVDADCTWSLALRQLKAVLAHDSELIDEEMSNRVRSLVDQLEPTSLRERVRLVVKEPPMPGFDETESSVSAQIEHRRAIVHALAEELLGESATLRELLPELSRGRQSLADELGESLAKSALSPLEWLERIVQAVVGVPASDRSYDLLSGFVAGLSAQFHEEVEAFKTQAAGSHDLAPAFPKICKRVGLSREDIRRAVDALDRGTLLAWDLHHWAYTWVLDRVPSSAVAPLIDVMLDHSAPSFALAVTILGRILSDEGREADASRPHIFELADFRPQVLKMARNAGRWSRTDAKPPRSLAGSGLDLNVAEYFFRQIVCRMLTKGREDANARAVALALARSLALGDHHGWVNPRGTKPSPVLTTLLAGFPEIAWPLVGGTIVANRGFASRMRYVLGRPYTTDRDIRPPILDLPEDTLFSWCHANPDGAPAFVAECVPILWTEGDEAGENHLHPVMSRLLEEFGDRRDVRRALESNIHPYSWSGSLSRYYSRYRGLLAELCRHQEPQVRQWAEEMRREVERYVRRHAKWDV